MLVLGLSRLFFNREDVDVGVENLYSGYFKWNGSEDSEDINREISVGRRIDRG